MEREARRLPDAGEFRPEAPAHYEKLLRRAREVGQRVVAQVEKVSSKDNINLEARKLE